MEAVTEKFLQYSCSVTMINIVKNTPVKENS